VHLGHRRFLDLTFIDGPLKELLQASETIRGSRWLAVLKKLRDEALDVLALDLRYGQRHPPLAQKVLSCTSRLYEG